MTKKKKKKRKKENKLNMCASGHLKKLEKYKRNRHILNHTFVCPILPGG
jgi:hypothetical protein